MLLVVVPLNRRESFHPGVKIADDEKIEKAFEFCCYGSFHRAQAERKASFEIIHIVPHARRHEQGLTIFENCFISFNVPERRMLCIIGLLGIDVTLYGERKLV